MNEIINFIEINYPYLKSRLNTIRNSSGTILKIPFENPRYTLWIEENNDDSYIVGINNLHTHYDLEDKNNNRENAIIEVQEIINGKILVVGKKNISENYTLNTLELQMGIESIQINLITSN